MERRVDTQRKYYVEFTSEESKGFVSAIRVIKERNWSHGAKSGH